VRILTIDDSSVNLTILEKIAEKISPDNRVVTFIDPVAALGDALEQTPDQAGEHQG